MILFAGTGYFAQDMNLDADAIEFTAILTNNLPVEETSTWYSYLPYTLVNGGSTLSSSGAKFYLDPGSSSV